MNTNLCAMLGTPFPNPSGVASSGVSSSSTKVDQTFLPENIVVEHLGTLSGIIKAKSLLQILSVFKNYNTKGIKDALINLTIKTELIVEVGGSLVAILPIITELGLERKIHEHNPATIVEMFEYMIKEAIEAKHFRNLNVIELFNIV